jgi:hypothetical protein
LESKFKPGMSWEKRGLIHIDHIIPCASFDLKDPKQQAASIILTYNLCGHIKIYLKVLKYCLINNTIYYRNYDREIKRLNS